ncbi:MAG: pectate lyase [Planctomycetota bacterium]|nr:MAG: pectate lyase [Planctomycetota bacterium]
MSRATPSILLTVACSLTIATQTVCAAEAIPLKAFSDGIKHWKNGQDSDGYDAYEAEQVREIADNLLLYQRANGGWPPNFDPLRILTAAERKQIQSRRQRIDTSFDNRATYPEVEYLALAYAHTGDTRYRDAAVRGIDFMLEAQHASGGWPHSYPVEDGYKAQITIVDDVMVGVLRTLRKIAGGAPPFDFLDDERRDRVAAALDLGNRCLLDLQVEVDGQRTGWASQYDRETLEPTTGRSFELPGLISAESAGVLRYLMSFKDPSPEVRQAIRAGVGWLERSKIDGLRIERVPAETVRYKFHTSSHDVVAVEDAEAPPIWARFYEVDTNRPFMANRDGKKVYRLAEVTRERRTGYSWYGTSPAKLLDQEYPAWEAKWGGNE